MRFLCALIFNLAMVGFAHAQSVGLGWDSSTDPNVTGYNFYFGTQSGNYTSLNNMGTNLTALLNNLTPGVTYYFAVTAYDSATNESDLSAEIVYTAPGTLTLTMSSGPSKYGIVGFTAFAGHWYELQASTDLPHWTTIWSTTTAVSNTVVSYPDVSSSGPYQNRFYRYVQH